MINKKNNPLMNQKLVLYLIIGLFALMADVYLLIKPVVGGLLKVLPEVSEKASRVSIMKVDIKNIPAYEMQIKNLESKLSGYKRKFSTKEEISPLLKNLSDTAKTCNVKILSITPLGDIQGGSAKIESAYRKFPIYVSAVSEYHSFGLFLNKLENSDTFMRVVDLKIIGDSSGAQEHKFDVVIVTYILTPPEEAQKEAQKQVKEVKKKQVKK